MKVINTSINGNKNIKLCLISDIHFSYKFNNKVFYKIVNNIKINKPNYICITGDIIDFTDIENIDEMKYLYDFIKDLSKISKVIISLGNHDYTNIVKHQNTYKYPYKFVNNIKTIDNVVLLDNEKYIENGICFIGYTESYEVCYNERANSYLVIDELNSLLKDIDIVNYNILLSHDPLYLTLNNVNEKIDNYKKLNLILSGHTHNGMIPNFIKTNHMLVSPSKKWFEKDGRGHMLKNNVDIIVSGGITKLSRKAGIFHLFNFLYSINIDYIIIGGSKNGGTQTKK